jgi:hypothetical protein
MKYLMKFFLVFATDFLIAGLAKGLPKIQRYLSSSDFTKRVQKILVNCFGKNSSAGFTSLV